MESSSAVPNCILVIMIHISNTNNWEYIIKKTVPSKLLASSLSNEGVITNFVVPRVNQFLTNTR